MFGSSPRLGIFAGLADITKNDTSATNADMADSACRRERLLWLMMGGVNVICRVVVNLFASTGLVRGDNTGQWHEG